MATVCNIRLRVCIVAAACVISTDVLAAEVGFNFYGLSYHTNRRAAKSLNFNEFNPGFGASFSFLQFSTGYAFVEGGMFKDTFDETASYVGLGYKQKLAGGLFIGAMPLYYTSLSVNKGQSLLAIVPAVSFRFGLLSANLVYMPRKEPVNRYSWVGFYLTVYGAKRN